jgi:cell division protein FtsB
MDRPAMSSGFKYLVGAAAFFIAGCSAYFSVRGLGLLFVGSATAVMIMASSLEVGKLVAASFLYRYWYFLNRPMKFYLTVAVVLLIGITSLGNYGYLARAYEKTQTQVGQYETQIAALEKEIADTERQIESSRTQLDRVSGTGREDISNIQNRITQAGTLHDQAMIRLQQRRQTAQDRRDHDMKVLTDRQAEQAEVNKNAIASIETGINDFNARLAVLDRAVDAYTKQGGPGIFKVDSVKKGQELFDKQKSERDAIAKSITKLRTQQEDLRTAHTKLVESTNTELAAIRGQFDQEIAKIDADEQQLRAANTTSVAEAQQQLAALQAQGQTVSVTGDTQIEAMHERIRSRNDEILHLRQQIAATDIGSYRFVARAFNAPPDNIVKWLMFALVIVFDPLAVCLAVGFNVALLQDPRRRISPLGMAGGPDPIEPAMAGSVGSSNGRRNRLAVFGTSLLIVVLGAGGIAVAGKWGMNEWRVHASTSHTTMVPGDSFAVITLRPGELGNSAQGQGVANWLSQVGGKPVADAVALLTGDGFDRLAPVYAFARFPGGRDAEKSERPAMLCGLVARVTDPSAAEATLSELAEQINGAIRSSVASAPSLTRNRAMIRYGTGRYMDPEGGFFTFGLTDKAAILLIEFEGDPKAPRVEKAIQTCLAAPETVAGLGLQAGAGNALPSHALDHEGAVAIWFDAGRFFQAVPKNASAQARYQQLQRHLNFDLTMDVEPLDNERVRVLADYRYDVDRFKGSQQPTAVELLAGLGTDDNAGIAGRFMDRCADTLDYDSLIERLRAALGGAEHGSAQQVLVEKSFESARDARFVLTARYNPQAGPPLMAAMQTLLQ